MSGNFVGSAFAPFATAFSIISSTSSLDSAEMLRSTSTAPRAQMEAPGGKKERKHSGVISMMLMVGEKTRQSGQAGWVVAPTAVRTAVESLPRLLI